MRPYKEEDLEWVLTLAYDHGGLTYVNNLLLALPILELHVEEGRGFIGYYTHEGINTLVATKDDNKFTIAMWRYLKKLWFNPETTSVISVVDNHETFDHLLSKYNIGSRVRDILINPKET